MTRMNLHARCSFNELMKGMYALRNESERKPPIAAAAKEEKLWLFGKPLERSLKTPMLRGKAATTLRP